MTSEDLHEIEEALASVEELFNSHGSLTPREESLRANVRAALTQIAMERIRVFEREKAKGRAPE